MEAWRLMLYSVAIMIVWGIVVALLGLDVGPIQVVLAFLIAMVAFYTADMLTDRYLD